MTARLADPPRRALAASSEDNAPPDRTEETAMHPTISYHLAQARMADLRHQAQQAALARAARRARPGPREHTAPRWLTPGRLARRSPAPQSRQAPVAGPGEAAPALTPRELDVLKLVAQGLSNPDIARQLVLSEHTVHRHLANVLRKLSLSSRAAAAVWGVRTGVV
jgi:DNA-binding NarL/FixJ family response regulator